MHPYQDNDRRVSFGRGGAGNIRNASEATLPDVPEGYLDRRRSSVWSSGSSASSTSKKNKLFGSINRLFSSKRDETTESKERML